MKKIILLMAIVLLFVTCKKDKKVNPIPILDVTGSWALYSNDDTFFSVGKVTADQYPCIAQNVLTFHSDSTYSSKYMGSSICYVSANQGGAGSVWVGDPSSAAQSGTWHRNGNDVYIGLEHYVITNINNKLTLTYNGSFVASGVTYYITQVSYKE